MLLCEINISQQENDVITPNDRQMFGLLPISKKQYLAFLISFSFLFLLNIFASTLISFFCSPCHQRYHAVVHPLNSRSKLTRRKLKFIISGCWLTGCLWNAPLFVTVTFREDLGTCGERWPNTVLPVVYSFGWSVVAGIIPVSIMAYLYSRVVNKLWFETAPAVQSASAVSRWSLSRRKREAWGGRELTSEKKQNWSNRERKIRWCDLWVVVLSLLHFLWDSLRTESCYMAFRVSGNV